MATYTVKQKYLIDNFAVLELLTPAELEIGWAIDVDGVDVTFDGAHTIYALPQYQLINVDQYGDLVYDPFVPLANQVCFQLTADAVARQAATGTLTWTPNVCTWITAAQLVTYLGISITNPSDDYTLVTQAVSAGNTFAFRRRYEAGYVDQLGTSPGGDCTLGTLMYAAALWRSRGSIQDTFASFDGMGTGSTQAMTPMIKQLLGIDRPQCA